MSNQYVELVNSHDNFQKYLCDRIDDWSLNYVLRQNRNYLRPSELEGLRDAQYRSVMENASAMKDCELVIYFHVDTITIISGQGSNRIAMFHNNGNIQWVFTRKTLKQKIYSFFNWLVSPITSLLGLSGNNGHMAIKDKPEHSQEDKMAVQDEPVNVQQHQMPIQGNPWNAQQHQMPIQYHPWNAQQHQMTIPGNPWNAQQHQMPIQGNPWNAQQHQMPIQCHPVNVQQHMYMGRVNNVYVVP